MKRMMVMLALLAVSSTALASPAITKDGEVACLTKEWYEDMISFSIADDIESIETYVELKRCMLMKGGLRVTVTDSPGMLGSKVGFIYKGFEFWGGREALEYNP